MSSRARAALLAIAGLLASACVTRVGDLSVMSPRITNLPTRSLDRRVEGMDCVYFALLFLPVSGSLFPSVEEAIDRAMQAVPEGNIVTNVAMYVDSAGVPPLVHRQCIRIKGDVGVLE
jgi:hypothetical protein